MRSAIVPGILAIRPPNTLIKERLRHERAT